MLSNQQYSSTKPRGYVLCVNPKHASYVDGLTYGLVEEIDNLGIEWRSFQNLELVSS